jgi:hypothetical protein
MAVARQPRGDATQRRSVSKEKQVARGKDAGNGEFKQTLATLMQPKANLIQHQTALMQQQSAFLARASEIDARVGEMDRINTERFARIEDRYVRIEALLLEHNRILQALPDAIRDKTGFKSPGS